VKQLIQTYKKAFNLTDEQIEQMKSADNLEKLEQSQNFVKTLLSNY
jgi:hypothetical protein